MGTLKQLGAAFVGSKIITGLVGMSDELTQTTARLNLMNDGLQSTADLQDVYKRQTCSIIMTVRQKRRLCRL